MNVLNTSNFKALTDNIGQKDIVWEIRESLGIYVSTNLYKEDKAKKIALDIIKALSLENDGLVRVGESTGLQGGHRIVITDPSKFNKALDLYNKTFTTNATKEHKETPQLSQQEINEQDINTINRYFKQLCKEQFSDRCIEISSKLKEKFDIVFDHNTVLFIINKNDSLTLVSVQLSGGKVSRVVGEKDMPISSEDVHYILKLFKASF